MPHHLRNLIILLTVALATVAHGALDGGHEQNAPLLIRDTVPATAMDMVGGQICFSAVFSNSPAAQFQWQKIVNGTTNDIPGATTTTLTLTNLQLADSALYRLKAVNAANTNAIIYTTARPLTVAPMPNAVNNIITATAAQTGLGRTTIFTPTWSITTNNNLIAGLLPSKSRGRFSLEARGRELSSLTDGGGGALSVIIDQGPTSSTNYLTFGNGNWAGSYLIYKLPESKTGYDLGNITVYGGWADGQRDQQAYTVYFSTVAAPALFVPLTTVNFTPINPSNAQSATRVTLTPANGALATNVAAIKFDFTKPSSKNGYSGYSQIIISGTPSPSMPPGPPPEITTDVSSTFDYEDWLGSWIWDSKTHDKQTCNFWKSFEIPKNKRIRNATLIMAADNEYTLLLDGQLIGRIADWREFWKYDVTLMMSPGRHQLAVKAYNSISSAGMIFALHIEMEGGETLEIKSDSSWRIVPEGTRRWETRSTAADSWPAATVVAEAGQPPWNAPPQFITSGPPLQPIKILFWQTLWFQISFFTLCGATVLTLIYLFIQRSHHQKEQWLLQRERSRIAMDVHDDIGSRITQLVLNGEVAQSDLASNSPAHQKLEQICDDARKVLASIDEILWALNPREDTLQGFADYICDYTQKFLAPAGIECVFQIDSSTLDAAAALPLRRSLLMAIKETLHNAVKYSEATELTLKIERQRQNLVIVVQDNGRGFDSATIPQGRNGLSNMTRRMRELGGNCHITSQIGKGCRIEFCLPLRHSRKFPWLWQRKP